MITPKQKDTLAIAMTVLVTLALLFLVGVIIHNPYLYIVSLIGLGFVINWIGNITDTR